MDHLTRRGAIRLSAVGAITFGFGTAWNSEVTAENKTSARESGEQGMDAQGRKALEKLSQWGCIEYAARCARRIQWLFLLAHPKATPEEQDAIDTAIAYAEHAAWERKQQ